MARQSHPLRVNLVTTSLMLGGAELQVFNLAMELHRRGHAVSVTTMRDPEDLTYELSEAGIPLYSLGMRRGVPDPRALLRLAQLIRSERPNVVHSHMVHANLLTRLCRWMAPIPVLISTAHSISEGARWREVAYRLTDFLCDMTTNVCRQCVSHFIEVGAVPKKRIRYIPNGIDIEAFTASCATSSEVRQQLGISENTFLWLAVGHLEEAKDYPNLIDAFASLVAHNTGSGSGSEGFRLLVVGAGSLEQELRQKASLAGLDESHLLLLGARTDVSSLMAAADALVMSSAWEGLPTVLLEAGALSLPAVVTDVGGNRELVTNGLTGFVAPPGDFRALAEEMSRMMELSSADRQEMGRRLRHLVEVRFGLGAVVDQWEQLYWELLEAKSEASRTRQ